MHAYAYDVMIKDCTRVLECFKFSMLVFMVLLYVFYACRANRENIADHGGNLTCPTVLPTGLLGHVGRNK